MTRPDERLSPHFLQRELETSATRPDLVEPIPLLPVELLDNARRVCVELLEPLRGWIGAPVRVLSGYRSARLNQAVGGSPTSQHRRASAADVTTADVERLANAFEALVDGELPIPCGQVVIYPGRGFLHLALPSATYPRPSYHVHAPAKGVKYRRVLGLRELQALGIARGFDLVDG